MYIHVYIYVYIHIHVYFYIHIDSYIHTYMYAQRHQEIFCTNQSLHTISFSAWILQECFMLCKSRRDYCRRCVFFPGVFWRLPKRNTQLIHSIHSDARCAMCACVRVKYRGRSGKQIDSSELVSFFESLDTNMTEYLPPPLFLCAKVWTFCCSVLQCLAVCSSECVYIT